MSGTPLPTDQPSIEEGPDTAGEDQVLLRALLEESRRGTPRPVDADLAAQALRVRRPPGALIEEQDAYASQGGARFTYRVQDRYSGWSTAWGEIGKVEVASPEPHVESVKGYAPGYVHPELWPIILDGCATRSPDDSGLTFDWTVNRDGETVAVREGAGCEVPFGLPEEGEYEVTLEVRSADGWEDSVSGRVLIDDIVVLSLGDSAASGEGNPDESGLKVGWVDRRCHRSTGSGHALTAEALEDRSDKTSVTYLSFACSGAEIDSGILGPYAGISSLGPPAPSELWEFKPLAGQIAAAREALCSVPVGDCRPQDMRQVDYIFISIGINDLSFTDVLILCANLDFGLLSLPRDVIADIFNGGCNDDVNLNSMMTNASLSLSSEFEPWAEKVLACDLSDAEWQELLGYIPTSPPPFCFDGHETFAELRRQLVAAGISVDNVYLSTYPADPFSGTGRGCEVLSLITAPEARWLSEWGQLLNERIHLEAIANGFYSIPGITEAFRSRGYCVEERYFVQLNEALLNQGDKFGTIHPNRRGHEAIRDAHLQAIAATKPDRVSTHRATAIINRIRFDVPEYETNTAYLEVSLSPYESLSTVEITTGDRYEDGVAPVIWKRAIELLEPFDVSSGEWLTLPDPVRLAVNLAPSDGQLRFSAFARIDGDGGAMQRARPQPPADSSPGGGPLPDGDGAIGFYLVDLDVDRTAPDSGEGGYVLQSQVDLGQNVGSMTVDFCIVISEIQPTRPRPNAPGSQLGCPDRVID